ncbi:F0F1-type ATP synthase assembly protein I [Flavobacterium sp. 7A]|nr:F0F1-type ATP synthase assembly protein I [Flavobacterium sp. 7A]
MHLFLSIFFMIRTLTYNFKKTQMHFIFSLLHGEYIKLILTKIRMTLFFDSFLTVLLICPNQIRKNRLSS